MNETLLPRWIVQSCGSGLRDNQQICLTMLQAVLVRLSMFVMKHPIGNQVEVSHEHTTEDCVSSRTGGYTCWMQIISDLYEGFYVQEGHLCPQSFSRFCGPATQWQPNFQTYALPIFIHTVVTTTLSEHWSHIETLILEYMICFV